MTFTVFHPSKSVLPALAQSALAARLAGILSIGIVTAAGSPALALTSAPKETAISGAEASVASPTFDITINFGSGLTASQQAIFADAEYFWETIITGFQIGFATTAGLFVGPTITAASAADDGVGGTLGSAGPTSGYNVSDGVNTFAYVATGAMNFDSADIGNMESNGTLFDVIVHEIGHVIGFGTMWNPAEYGSAFAGSQNLYTDGTGQYTGESALAWYNWEFGLSELFVPVENNGAAGTTDAHWDEDDFAGGSRDIMTGYLGGAGSAVTSPFVASTLSLATIASFNDIGYTTIVPFLPAVAAVPLPAGLGLALFGLASLGAVSRRRKRVG